MRMRVFNFLVIFVMIIGCSQKTSFDISQYNVNLNLIDSDRVNFSLINPTQLVITPGDKAMVSLIEGLWLHEHDEVEKGSWVSTAIQKSRIVIFSEYTDFEKLHIKMASCKEFKWKKMSVKPILNGVDLEEVTLYDSPSWFSFNIPENKIKSGINNLEFVFFLEREKNIDLDIEESKWEKKFRIKKLIFGQIEPDAESNFVFQGRVTISNENRECIISNGQAVLSFSLPDHQGGILSFMHAYPSQESLDTNIRVVSSDGEQIAQYTVKKNKSEEWEKQVFYIDPEVKGIRIRVEGKTAISALSFSMNGELVKTIKPDVVLITMDTLRADYIGTNGNSFMLTPTIDRLALTGHIFSNAYSQAAVTNPSHSSILTGMYVNDHNVLGNSFRLGNEAITLAEMFKEKGYYTISAVSAVHMSDESSGFGQGFDVHFTTDAPKQDGKQTVQILAEEIANPNPLFVFLHLFDPHVPYEASVYNNYYEPKNIYVDPKRLIENERFDLQTVQYWMSQYAAEITDCDRALYRFLTLVQAQERNRPLFLILTSDHGESLYEHGLFFQHHSGLYEPHVRVPLIICPDFKNGESRLIDTPVENFSVAKTLSKVFNLNHGGKVRGQYLLDPSLRSLNIHSEAAAMGLALWQDNHKIITSKKKIGGYKTNALFNLQNDPYELNDLSGTHKKKYKSMREKSLKWLSDNEKKQQGMLSKPRMISIEDKAKLQALGYMLE